MASDKGFHDYLLHDVFADIDGITSRAMFGGYGIYKNSVIFAIIAEGKLYFKVGEGNKADYEAHGSKPFVYVGHNGKPYEMSYWELPTDILENKDKLLLWVEKSFAVKSKSKK